MVERLRRARARRRDRGRTSASSCAAIGAGCRRSRGERAGDVRARPAPRRAPVVDHQPLGIAPLGHVGGEGERGGRGERELEQLRSGLADAPATRRPDSRRRRLEQRLDAGDDLVAGRLDQDAARAAEQRDRAASSASRAGSAFTAPPQVDPTLPRRPAPSTRRLRQRARAALRRGRGGGRSGSLGRAVSARADGRPWPPSLAGAAALEA